MQGNGETGEMPLFVLATRLYVRYKFKTRRTFDPQRTMSDDVYAREVLLKVRATGDAQLLAMADHLEQARFGAVAAPASVRAAEPAASVPMLDLSLESPG